MGLVLLLAALVGLAGACGSGSAGGEENPVGPVAVPIVPSVPGAPGRLVWSQINSVVALEPATGQRTTLVTLPENSYAGSPALSPDGQWFALTAFRSNPLESGASLYRVPSAGGEPELVLSYEQAGGSIEYPSWSPDGTYIYATVTDPAGPGAYWLIRVPRDGGPPERLLQGGNYPVVSPDGKTLVYVKADSTGQLGEIWRANPDGSEPQPIPGTRFAGVVKPSFAPDGSTLAFSANGDPLASEGVGDGLPLFGPAIASAHGTPWDAWTIPVGGGTPERRSDIREDQPVVAWSPDGQWLGMNGEVGLYILRLSDGQLYNFGGSGGAGLVWMSGP